MTQGLDRNKQKIATRAFDGTPINVIPDSITPFSVIEVKNVKYVSRTKQIQGELNAAKDVGKVLRLDIGVKTSVSKPLKQLEKTDRKSFLIKRFERLDP